MSRFEAVVAFLGLVGILAQPAYCQALLKDFDNKDGFLSSTGAVAEAPIPCDGACFCIERTIGVLTYRNFDPFCGGGDGQMFFGDAAPTMPGCEIAINGCENLEITVGDAPVYAIGFDFFEPSSGGCTFIDSDFTLTLFSGDTPIGSFDFNVEPEDEPAFVGVWSSEPFDRIQVDELNTGCENDFYGNFYTAHQPALPVPTLSEWAVVTMTLLLLVGGTVVFRKTGVAG